MKKDVERKESMSIEESKKLKVVDIKKLSKLFKQIEDEVSEKAMPEGGAMFFTLRFPNEDGESDTFMCSLNGVGTEVIKSFAGIADKNETFRGMLQRAVMISGGNPIEKLLNNLFD